MRNFVAAWLRVLAIALLSTVAVSAAGAGVPPPPETFGALPLQSNVRLSPDGRWLAWTDNGQVKPHVVMFDLEAGKVKRLLAVPEEAKIRELAWNDNETLLIVLSTTNVSRDASERSREYFRVIAHDVSGGDGRMLPLAQLIAWRTTKPHTVIMAVRACKQVIASCLIEVDTRTGDRSVLKVGNEFTADWVVDRDGHAVARADWDHYKHAYRVLALSSDSFGEESVREVFRTDDSEPPDLSGLLPDGGRPWYCSVQMVTITGRPGHCHWTVLSSNCWRKSWTPTLPQPTRTPITAQLSGYTQAAPKQKFNGQILQPGAAVN